MTAVLATLPTPSFLSMLAHRYPLHEQAPDTHRTRPAHAPPRTRPAPHTHGMQARMHARLRARRP